MRILHVLRAPLGGLFRHVVDLAGQQADRGHEIGFITDSTTGGARAAALIESLGPKLALGALRIPMRRPPHATDLLALARVERHVAALRPDVVHGHGAKGGLYARLPGLLKRDGIVRAYTPHGGSFNYKPGTTSHRAFMAVEGLLARATDLLLFESGYIASRYEACVAADGPLRRVIVNGVSEAEFLPVSPDPDAADLLYVGELRSAKGIDTLIDALTIAGSVLDRPPSLVLVGSGPDQDQLERKARRRGVDGFIRFAGPMPARAAFRLGRILAVPSRAESLPYVVLEAAAAQMPMIATRVGGIPEIFGPSAHRLIPSDDPAALSQTIVEALRSPPDRLHRNAADLAAFVRGRFTLPAMVDGVLAGYADALRRTARADAAAASLSVLPS